MTTDEELIHTSENADAIQAGKDAVQIIDRREMFEGVPIAINGNGDVCLLADVLQYMDTRADAPRRRKGIAKLTELDSFVAHVNRAKLPESAVFADGEKLTAVYNYYPANKAKPSGSPPAAWADHRAVYSCPLSEEWQAWTAQDGRRLSQDALAELLDERNGDIFDDEDPAVAKRIAIIGLTTELQVHTKGTFQKKINRTTGAGELICKTEHADSSTPIPAWFKLQIPVFVGGKAYPILARLQLRINDGNPAFTYKLQRAAEVKRQAFDEIRATVIEKTGLPVFAGTPEA